MRPRPPNDPGPTPPPGPPPQPPEEPTEPAPPQPGEPIPSAADVGEPGIIDPRTIHPAPDVLSSRQQRQPKQP